MDVAMSTVTATSSLHGTQVSPIHQYSEECMEPSYVAVDPLEPMLSTVPGSEILQVVDRGDPLRFGRPKEVFLDRIGAGLGK